MMKDVSYHNINSFQNDIPSHSIIWSFHNTELPVASGQHDNTRYRKIRGNHPNRWRTVNCPVGGAVVKRTWYRNGMLLQDTDPMAAYQGPGLYRCVLQQRGYVKAVAMINVTRNYTIEAHNEDTEDDMVTPYKLNACRDSKGVVVKDANAEEDGVITVNFNQPNDDIDDHDDTVILDDADMEDSDNGDNDEMYNNPIPIPSPPAIDDITNNTEQFDASNDGHMTDHTTTIIVTCVTICGLIGIIGTIILLLKERNRKHLPANVRQALDRLLNNDIQHVNHLPDNVL